MSEKSSKNEPGVKGLMHKFNEIFQVRNVKGHRSKGKVAWQKGKENALHGHDKRENLIRKGK